MSKVTERLVPVFVILIVAMLVVPLPWYLLDLLLAANFSISIGMMLHHVHQRALSSRCSRRYSWS